MDYEIKIVAVDVDGTLTESSRSLRLSPHSLSGIKLLVDSGYTVVLVSGSSLPVVASLALYLGSRGPIVAENGCIVFYSRELIEDHVCKNRPSIDAVKILEAMGFRWAWQNKYRLYDLAFHTPPNFNREVLEQVKRAVEPFNLKVTWSGFALHLQPLEAGKDKGIEAILRKLNLSWDNVAAIGDGENDIPMLVKARLSAATSDSHDSVKKAVKLVMKEPGGKGFLEFAKLLAGGVDYEAGYTG